MKIKIIKKMLSVFLTISSLAAATFFVSAEKGDQHDLESQIAECDVIIEECNEAILYFKKEKDSKIGQINNDLKALEEIEKNYQNDIKLPCEIKQQQIGRKSELKKKLDELGKEEKNLKENINDLIEKSTKLGIKFTNLPQSDISKLDGPSRINLINFPDTCRRFCRNHPLSKDGFNELHEKFIDLKNKVDAICQSAKSYNKFENLQNKYAVSDQSKKNTNLWQMINSGSQCYTPTHVADNLCWLHSATNIRNYYNNMNNKGIIKGQRQAVQEYEQIMGNQAVANNINGTMQEFSQIAEYLQQCGLGSFQMIISSSSKDAQQKVKSTAKELLKTHFNKIQNTSPVIGHINGTYGHFITIADYDENADQFLIVDSSNSQSIEANVEWRKSEEFLQALIKQGFFGENTIELDFTSDVPGLRSVGLTVNENNSIVQRNWMAENAEEIQTSIDILKDMIKNY